MTRLEMGSMILTPRPTYSVQFQICCSTSTNWFAVLLLQHTGKGGGDAIKAQQM